MKHVLVVFFWVKYLNLCAESMSDMLRDQATVSGSNLGRTCLDRIVQNSYIFGSQIVAIFPARRSAAFAYQ